MSFQEARLGAFWKTQAIILLEYASKMPNRETFEKLKDRVLPEYTFKLLGGDTFGKLRAIVLLGFGKFGSFWKSRTYSIARASL